MGMKVANIDSDRKHPIDWMCIARYALYGALLGGLLADQALSPSGASVYLGAMIGAILLSAIKLIFLSSKK